MSTYCLKLKFPTENGVGEVKGDQGKIRREGGSPRNYGASRRRANKDYKSRDYHEYRHEKETSPAP